MIIDWGIRFTLIIWSQISSPGKKGFGVSPLKSAEASEEGDSNKIAKIPRIMKYIKTKTQNSVKWTVACVSYSLNEKKWYQFELSFLNAKWYREWNRSLATGERRRFTLPIVGFYSKGLGREKDSGNRTTIIYKSVSLLKIKIRS